MIGDAKEGAKNAAAKVSKKASELADDAKELAGDAKEKAGEFADDAKKAASDAPSWVKQHPEGKPYVHENGKDFANRMMSDKYGDNWRQSHPTGPGSEYNKIKKYGDRSFQ